MKQPNPKPELTKIDTGNACEKKTNTEAERITNICPGQIYFQILVVRWKKPAWEGVASFPSVSERKGISCGPGDRQKLQALSRAKAVDL